MRKSRNADVVTSSHHSDEEEELEDSEDDWQPEKVRFLFNKPIMMDRLLKMADWLNILKITIM